jgi:hypothetical protein
MSCNRSANRLSALELQFAALQNLVSAKFADLASRLQLAEQMLTKTQAELAANRAADALADAKDNLLESAVRANTLDLAALKLQALADEALLSSTASAAAAAQFTASVARSEAQAAQQKADADAVATLAVKAVAEAAQASASQAQAALAALASRFRNVRVATPAVGITGTMTMAITWPTPFADSNYNAGPEFEGLALLGLEGAVSNRTPTGCTVTAKNILGLALLAGAGTLTVTAIHD